MKSTQVLFGLKASALAIVTLCWNTVNAWTTTAMPLKNDGLLLVDYIIIGVTAASVSAAIILVIVVFCMNRRDKKKAAKIGQDPNSDKDSILEKSSSHSGKDIGEEDSIVDKKSQKGIDND
jgi:hypothetical protein